MNNNNTIILSIIYIYYYIIIISLLSIYMNNTNIIWYIYIPASYHLLKALSFSLRRKQKSQAKIGFINIYNILGYSERIPIFFIFFFGLKHPWNRRKHRWKSRNRRKYPRSSVIRHLTQTSSKSPKNHLRQKKTLIRVYILSYYHIVWYTYYHIIF